MNHKPNSSATDFTSPSFFLHEFNHKSNYTLKNMTPYLSRGWQLAISVPGKYMLIPYCTVGKIAAVNSLPLCQNTISPIDTNLFLWSLLIVMNWLTVFDAPCVVGKSYTRMYDRRLTGRLQQALLARSVPGACVAIHLNQNVTSPISIKMLGMRLVCVCQIVCVMHKKWSFQLKTKNGNCSK